MKDKDNIEKTKNMIILIEMRVIMVDKWSIMGTKIEEVVNKSSMIRVDRRSSSINRNKCDRSLNRTIMVLKHMKKLKALKSISLRVQTEVAVINKGEEEVEDRTSIGNIITMKRTLHYPPRTKKSLNTQKRKSRSTTNQKTTKNQF